MANFVGNFLDLRSSFYAFRQKLMWLTKWTIVALQNRLLFWKPEWEFTFNSKLLLVVGNNPVC
jgi:hypothetical protein